MRVIGVVGWKNSGKTALVTRLIAEWRRRGRSVSSIKHAHHVADVDVPGTDSHRHREAGAGEVILATPRRWALMAEAPSPDLPDLIARLSPCEIVVVEGFKAAGIDKIEAWRGGREPIALGDARGRAVAADAAPGVSVPVLDLNDEAAIADFVEREVWRV